MNTQLELDSLIDKIHNYTNSPNNQANIDEILNKIYKGINDNSIKLKKNKVSIHSFFLSKKNDDENIYLDMSELLKILSTNAEYFVQFKQFLSQLTVESIDFDEIINILSSSLEARAINENATIELLKFYLNNVGGLSGLLPGKNNLLVYPYIEDNASILTYLISNKFDNAILLLKQYKNFQIFLNTDVLLSNLESKEVFDYARKYIDFSKCKIQFHSIQEEVLIELIKTFPDRMNDLKNIEYDHSSGDAFKGNLLEYAAHKNFSDLLDYLIKNHIKNFNSVSQNCINSLKVAEQIKRSNIEIKDQVKNVYCLELMLINGEPLPSELLPITFSNSDVKASTSNRLSNVANYMLNNGDKQILNLENLDMIIRSFAYTNHGHILEKAIQNMAGFADNKDCQNRVCQLFKDYISHPGSPELVELLLKHFSAIILENLKDQVETSGIRDPRMICLLLKYNFTVPDDKIKECHSIACVESNEAAIAFLSAFVEDKTNHWKYLHLQSSEPARNEVRAIYYGTGISQEQYQVFQANMVNMMVGNLLNQTFKFIPSNQKTANKNTSSLRRIAKSQSSDDENNQWASNVFDDNGSDSEEPTFIQLSKSGKVILSVRGQQVGEIFADARFVNEKDEADENAIFALEKKYSTECNLIILGICRYWIAKISQSENHKYFGSYRTESLETPRGDGRYNQYFERFINNYDTYKETTDIKIDSPAIIDNAEVYCTIIGMIDDEPIQLTKYGMTQIGYGWIHASTESIPRVLEHCQELIDGIVNLKIDNKQVDDIHSLSEKIGQLHWWLAHGCPFIRGSASVTEVICRALFKFHGMDVSWKSMPDCEALITPKESDYAANYFSLLNVIPLPLKSSLEPEISMRNSI